MAVKKQMSIKAAFEWDKLKEWLDKARRDIEKFAAETKNAMNSMFWDSLTEKQLDTFGDKAFNKMNRSFASKFANVWTQIGRSLWQNLLNEMNIAGDKVGKSSTDKIWSVLWKGFKNVADWFKKDLDNVWEWLKKVAKLGIATAVTVTYLWKQAMDEALTYSKSEAEAQSFLQYSKEDRATFAGLVSDLSKKYWVDQSQIFAAAKDLKSQNVEWTPKEIAKVLESSIKFNQASGGETQLSESIGQLVWYLSAETGWKGIKWPDVAKNIAKLADDMQKMTMISWGKDALVKEQFATTAPQTSQGWLKRQEAMAVYASIAGKTGNEAEAATQIQTMSKWLFDLTPQARKTLQDLWMKESPEEYVKKNWFLSYLDKLKQILPQKLQQWTEEIRKAKADLEKLKKDKPISYEYLTETKDAQGNPVRVLTEKAKTYQKQIEEAEARLQEIISKYNDENSFEENPITKNLSLIEWNVRGSIPLLYLLWEWYEDFRAKLGEFDNTAGSVDAVHNIIQDTDFYRIEQAKQSWNDLVIGMWKQISPAAIDMFKELNQLLTENRETINLFIKNGMDFLRDSFKDFIKYMKEHPEAIKNFKDEVWKAWWALKQIWEFITTNVIPTVKKLIDWWINSSDTTKIVTASLVIFHNTIFALIWLVWSLTVSIIWLQTGLSGVQILMAWFKYAAIATWWWAIATAVWLTAAAFYTLWENHKKANELDEKAQQSNINRDKVWKDQNATWKQKADSELKAAIANKQAVDAKWASSTMGWIDWLVLPWARAQRQMEIESANNRVATASKYSASQNNQTIIVQGNMATESSMNNIANKATTNYQNRNGLGAWVQY